MTASSLTPHTAQVPAGAAAESAIPASLPRTRRKASEDAPHLLAGRNLIVLRAAARLAAGVALRGAELLLTLHSDRIHQEFGFASFPDFARELLQLSPRTAKRRLTLARTFASAGPLRAAFLEGHLTACQILALRPLAGSPSLPFWMDLAETVPVRRLATQVREAVAREADATGAQGAGALGADAAGMASRADSTYTAGVPSRVDSTDPSVDPGIPTPKRVTFSAPASAVLVWDQGMAAARRILGWGAPAHLCLEAILAESETALMAEGDVAAKVPSESETDRVSEPPNSGSDKRHFQASDASAGSAIRLLPGTGAIPEPPRLTRALSPEAVQEFRQTLARLEQELQHLVRRAGQGEIEPEQSEDDFAQGELEPAHGGGDPRQGEVDRERGEDEPAQRAGSTVAAPAARGVRPLSQGTRSPEALLDDYRYLASLDRPLRLLRGKLLRLLWTHDLHRALGSTSLVDFAETHLGHSERTTRELIAEAFLFEDEPLLARAFRQGRIGVTQARLVQRVALGRTLVAHIARAESLTARQFDREVRFLQRLAEFAPEIWAQHPGPLPDPTLESTLLEGLALRGVDPTDVLKDLESRGLGVDLGESAAGEHHATRRSDRSHPSADCAADPAVNPLLMTRLEILLDLWMLHAYPQGVDDPSDAATLSAATLSATPLSAAPLSPATHFEATRSAVTPSGSAPDRQTLALPRWTTLTFCAADDLLDTWTSALHRLRAARGPLPTWACAVLLIQHALDVWLTTDPDRKPAEHRILERDDYLCRAPGCSSRRNLEVHHIRFRSQGGTDEPENKITLCHTHHHHAVHAGTIRLSGQAPGELTWELGTRNGRPPLLKLNGERILARR